MSGVSNREIEAPSDISNPLALQKRELGVQDSQGRREERG